MKNTVQSVRTWLSKQMEEIQKIPNENFRIVLLCSLVDAFAQQEANYASRNNAGTFADFLLKYSREFESILKSVCPSTLFYHSEKILPQNTQLELGEDYLVCADDITAQKEAERILALLNKEQRNYRSKQHRYAQLIYALRNKLAHELIVVGCEANFLEEDGDQIPHMVHGVSGYPKSWLLHIPEKFILDVAKSSIENYIDECERNNINPFCNNSMNRLCYLAWYEK